MKVIIFSTDDTDYCSIISDIGSHGIELAGIEEDGVFDLIIVVDEGNLDHQGDKSYARFSQRFHDQTEFLYVYPGGGKLSEIGNYRFILPVYAGNFRNCIGSYIKDFTMGSLKWIKEGRPVENEK